MARIQRLGIQLREMNKIVGQHKPTEPRPSRALRPPPPGPGTGKPGAPPIYDPIRFPHIAKMLAQEYGFTHEQMSKVFGVTTKTVDSWVIKYPEFKAAIREGKDTFDGVHVENALLKIALGYEYEEKSVKTVHIRGVDAEGKTVRLPAREITTTTKQMAPNARAIALWLTNRNPERWKMVTTVNANIKADTTQTKRTVNLNADLSKMNSAQLRLLRDVITNQTSESVEGGGTEEVQLLEYMDQAQDIMEAEFTQINP